MIKSVRKRDGSVGDYQAEKITSAISEAFLAAGIMNAEAPLRLARIAAEVAEEQFNEFVPPRVEDILHIVEKILIDEGYSEAAKAYNSLHQEPAKNYDTNHLFGASDNLKLSANSLEVLEKRYLGRNEYSQVVETPGEMFARVAGHISRAEAKYGGNTEYWRGKFQNIMRNLDFLPNSPTLMNAGLSLGQLSACFVLPVGDSLSGIFSALKHMALIHQSGGGTGFSFSRLRPRNDVVRATGGVASGPVSFMRIFDTATEVIKQGGRRRGANMGVLSCHHPDILEFVRAKEKAGFLENFNLSVAASDDFMRKTRLGGDIDLVNPRNDEVTGCLNASDLMNAITNSAWRGGEPGLIYIDRINAKHPISGQIEATNPCGEQPLLPFESCNLGSINLSRLVKRGEMDWEKLGDLVSLGVRFLDDVIDVNFFPLKQIKKITQRSRKIGLGVMGFADMLIKLNISYNSTYAVRMAESVMRFISTRGREESSLLAEERGSFPLFEEFRLSKWNSMRNATVTTVAPTGTISIIAGTSSGIEPLFALAFERHVLDGSRLAEVSPLFERMAAERGIYTHDLKAELARKGSIQESTSVPQDLKDLFVTALDIPPEQHVRIQAAFQKYTDSAVSKTVNLPVDATVSDVLNVYNLAYDLGCKGVTVFRYGSRSQVLYLGNEGTLNGCKYCG
jgi:ribonucleoside-diphosphate reductase alpha chain